jgi:hypothetical protein
MFRLTISSVTFLLSLLLAPVFSLAGDDRPVPPADPKSLEECRAYQLQQIDYAHVAIQKNRECDARNRATNDEDIVHYLPSCGGSVLSAFRSCRELSDAASCALAGMSEKMSACFEKARAAEQKHFTDALAQNEKWKKIETGKLLQGQYAAAESGTEDSRKSLQQASEGASRFEQDPAAARPDVETQTALAAKAGDDASQLKQAAEQRSVELKRSLQKEHERAEALAKELSMAHAAIYAYEAQARKAADHAASPRDAADDGAALRKSLQQERERASRLEQDLAAARRDFETQTALATKARDDASQLKQAAEQRSADPKRSLQKEHERAEALAKELSLAHAAIYAYEAQARKAADQAAGSREAAGDGAPALRKSLQQEQERAARLEQDLAAARRDVGTQTALVAKAREVAARSMQAAEQGSRELRRSLQAEHDRAEALAQNLSMVPTAIYAYQAQTRLASGQAAGGKQAEQSGAADPRITLVQAWERTARLEQELAAARGDVKTQAARASKAGAEATRLKQAADENSAEFLKSLRQERDKTTQLERELASERKTKEEPVASGAMTVGRVAQDKQPGADAIKLVTATQTSSRAARKKPDPENAAEVARLVARANVLLGQGDMGAARIVLVRAAETGNAQASFALAETYDPLVLRKWGAYGTLGDAAKARGLYARARAGGIEEARERFDALRK